MINQENLWQDIVDAKNVPTFKKEFDKFLEEKDTKGCLIQNHSI